MQSEKLEQFLGCSRLVYNIALETKIIAYQSAKINLHKYELFKQLSEWRNSDGFEWLKVAPVSMLRQSIEKLDKSFKMFFKGSGFPKYAKKGKVKSITFAQDVKIINNKVKLPNLGKINFFKIKRQFDGKIKQCHVIKQIDGWFACVVLEKEITVQPVSINNDNQVIGIDMGITHFATLSNSEHITNPRITKQFERQLRVLQRKLSRQVRFSNRWKRTKKQIAKLQQKIARKRKDYLHKISTDLVNRFDCIVVEDLKVSNMSKSAKGTIENPGRNVKAKSGLNKALLDVGINQFFTMLEYKCKWQGKTFIKVNPKHTSQICSCCGYKAKENRKSQSNFKCVRCGVESNADINAAQNIMARGLPTSVKVNH